MIARGIVGFDAFRRCGLLTAFVLALLAEGCGSSNGNNPSGTTGSNKILKPEDSYRYVNSGKGKQKVGLGRRERQRLAEGADDKAN